MRRDLTRSLKTGHTAAGVPLTLKLQLVNVGSNCAPLAGHVLYLWSCTPAGEYSLYSHSIVGEDDLRGAQVTDAQGRVSFQTVFPGCHAGRWPHLHFEVYPNLAAAVKGNVDHNAALVSQIAPPGTVCRAVYADPRYSGSLRNLGAVTLTTDNVFRDGVAAQTPRITQIPRITGSAAAGYTANLTVGLQP